jgi:V/A-type H+-transporting ATPase subunit E
MGRRELLEALQREGEETMAAITARGATAAAELRSQAEERLAKLRREDEQECERLCSERKRLLLGKAAGEAALIRLRAEHALALRLHEHARSSLQELAGADAEKLFSSLAAELPAMPWSTISTSPGDARRAAALFPDATIIPDTTISGGLKAATAGQSLTVDNTLEKRLERFWPDLLPQLLAELRGEPQ